MFDFTCSSWQRGFLLGTEKGDSLDGGRTPAVPHGAGQIWKGRLEEYLAQLCHIPHPYPGPPPPPPPPCGGLLLWTISKSCSIWEALIPNWTRLLPTSCMKCTMADHVCMLQKAFFCCCWAEFGKRTACHNLSNLPTSVMREWCCPSCRLQVMPKSTSFVLIHLIRRTKGGLASMISQVQQVIPPSPYHISGWMPYYLEIGGSSSIKQVNWPMGLSFLRAQFALKITTSVSLVDTNPL